MRPRQAVFLTPSKSSVPPQLPSCKWPASATHLGSTLLQHRGRGSHLLSTGDPPLCFLTLTKCKFSNSFVLKFIQNAGGIHPPLMANQPLQSGLGGRRIDRRAGTLSQSVDGIRGKIFKSFDQAAGPAHLHPINLCRSAEAPGRWASALAPNQSLSLRRGRNGRACRYWKCSWSRCALRQRECAHSLSP